MRFRQLTESRRKFRAENSNPPPQRPPPSPPHQAVGAPRERTEDQAPHVLCPPPPHYLHLSHPHIGIRTRRYLCNPDRAAFARFGHVGIRTHWYSGTCGHIGIRTYCRGGGNQFELSLIPDSSLSLSLILSLVLSLILSPILSPVLSPILIVSDVWF